MLVDLDKFIGCLKISQADRVELFQWLQDDALRYRCKIIVVQSNLPQGERLVQEGGMAGYYKISSIGYLNSFFNMLLIIFQVKIHL